MRVTVKGQVTIPKYIREKFRISPNIEMHFVEDGDRIYLTKELVNQPAGNQFRACRGSATIKMTTDEIMALTRENK